MLFPDRTNSTRDCLFPSVCLHLHREVLRLGQPDPLDLLLPHAHRRRWPRLHILLLRPQEPLLHCVALRREELVALVPHLAEAMAMGLV